ncbi:hypothetical protein FRB99_009020 [Tulasnella sp. 403]|nr:hypothetical protein FRB99_009020 [Tulasnella sp. 403]
MSAYTDPPTGDGPPGYAEVETLPTYESTLPDYDPNFQPRLFFFYGTLTNPGLLRPILRLNHTPRLIPARIQGYRIKFWGRYPVAVPRDQSNPDAEGVPPIAGKAFKVTSQRQIMRMQRYASAKYRVGDCQMEVEESGEWKQCDGQMFVWNPDAGEPSDVVHSASDS